MEYEEVDPGVDSEIDDEEIWYADDPVADPKIDWFYKLRSFAPIAIVLLVTTIYLPSTVGGKITVLRNVLVFAPVALTWIAVGEATKGFQEYIQTNTTGVANFLDFWQNGYDILPPEFRISEVALVDAIIILAVITLTLIASILGGKAEKQTSGGEAFADRERTALAIEIGLFMYDKQKPTASVINSSVANSVARLRTSTTALESSAKSLATTAKNLVSATKALDKSAKDIAAKKGKKVRQESSFDFDQFDSSNFGPSTYEAPKFEPVKFDFDKYEFGDLDVSEPEPKKKWKFR